MNAPARAVTTASLLAALVLAAAPDTARAQQLFDLVVSLQSNPLGDADRMAEYEGAIIDFSQAVFEATEGAHALGNVMIYTGSVAHERADVIWRRTGHPKSAVNGIDGPGHIYMVDSFTDGDVDGEDVDLLEDAELAGIGPAGAILAHEWSHYAYGLLDEHVVQPGDVAVRHTLMSSPWEVPADGSWAAFSVVSDGTTDDYRNTERTEHHRAYGVSAWELLATAPGYEDALLAPVPGLVERRFYPMLAAAAPSPLPVFDGGPPADPTITWIGPCASYAIAIDNSGSMTGQRLLNAKSAATTLVQRSVADRTWVSVLTFASAATANRRTDDPVLISDEGDEGETARDFVLDRIAEIAAVPQVTRFSAGVAEGKAMVDEGLVEIAAEPGCDPTRVSSALFFLSDGSNGDPDGTEETDLAAARDAFAADGIPIHVVDYGAPDPDAPTNPMTPLVAATGGLLTISSGGAGPIDRLFEESENQHRAAWRLHESDTLQLTVPDGGAAAVSFPVDPDVDRLTVCASTDAPVDELRLDSRTIAGIVPPTVSRRTETDFDECMGLPSCPLSDECSTLWSVTNASVDPGSWQVVGFAADDATSDVQVTVTAVAHAVDEATTLQAYVLNGTVPMPGSPPEITTPEPVYVAASLGRERPAVSARLFATLVGTPVQATLRDDGVPPDRRSDDGIYTGAVPTQGRSGDFEIGIEATNALAIAASSSRGLARSPAETGRRLAPEADVPLSPVLFRYTTVPVTLVDGGPPVTIVDPTPQNGEIAAPGEVDLYDVDLAQVGSGTLQVRVTGALLGMRPRITVTPPGGDPIQATARSGAGGVGIELDSSLGLVQVAVSHASGGTGTYQISAGVPLTREFGDAGFSNSPCELALADKNEALDALEAGLAGVPAAIALIEESRGLTADLFRTIEEYRAYGRVKKTGRLLEKAATRDTKALRRLRRAERQQRAKEIPGARRKIKNARHKLWMACRRLTDGGSTLLD